MGALSSLKILDFSTMLPGPLATMLLADLGADVVTVGAPGKPDLMNTFPPFIEEGLSASGAWLGRNKRTIELNLKKPEAVEAVKELVKEYDIVVEQFRPGVMARLGLGYEDLKAVNPAVIYCSISGYGQTGPYVYRVGHDLNYLSLSGNMLTVGENKQPAIPNFHLADIAGGGYMGALSILAAVQYREKTGKGQQIDLGLADAILPFGCIEALGELAAKSGATGWNHEQISGIGIGPNVANYETADGKWINISAIEPKFYEAVCNTLGLEELAPYKVLYKEPDRVREAFTAKFKEKTRDEWVEIFADVEACFEPVITVAEAWESEWIAAREMAPEVPLANGGGKTIAQIGNPIKLSECPAEYRHAAYPLGAHNAEVLGSIGLSEEAIANVTSNE